ncbi:MAG: efflux transporter outer membrane subunit [Bryobacteraceae bacterium]
MITSFQFAVCALTALSMSSCMVGPRYTPPAPPLPLTDAYKGAEKAGFQPAQPSDGAPKGPWWNAYHDARLSALEEQVNPANQNVQVAEAQLKEARAAIRIARSGLWPTLNSGVSMNEAHTSGAASAHQNYDFGLGAAWELDLWGRLRRSVAAANSLAQASAADLENVRLLYQAELAAAYYQLRGIDAKADLLRKTEALYSDSVNLTRNRYEAGVASPLDLKQAESQLYTIQSALLELGVQRAQLEHAIAVLTGTPPANLSIPPTPLDADPPDIPTGLPSQLLERRPDIAAAERRVAAANESIGIAMAAFYPTLSLSGSAGFQSGSFEKWFSMPTRFWSVGPALAETLLDRGRRRAVVDQQRAAYDAVVASYRQSVLSAFQQVEDNLAAMRILTREAAQIELTADAAAGALNISTLQYKAGMTSYLTVLTAQVSLLNAQIAAVEVRTRRMVASIDLMQAIGGGWSTSNSGSGSPTSQTE